MSSQLVQFAAQRSSKVTSLAMAVHDLKGHLAVIAGQAKLLLSGKRGAVTSSQIESLDDIVSGCKLIENQIAGILTPDLRESAPWKPVPAEADLRQRILHLYNSLQPEFAENRLRFEIDLCAQPMILPFDDRLVTRVLMNLLENARRFTPPGGTVNISLEPYFWERRTANLGQGLDRRYGKERNRPNAAKVVVADTGCGIAPEYHREIFEEYFSTPVPGGRASSGLGLAIVNKILQAHGGKIWVESTVGKGSRFCFLLPYVVSENLMKTMEAVECGN
ncbi:MAG: HAMP domain-containing sensor histidine kinase [Candidatus Korobacteraceae bacterium]|jgi:signal transduction histidine kinase